MPYKLTLVLTPKQAADVKYYTEQAARRAGVAEQDVALVRVVGRSIDARQRQPKVNLTLEVYADCEPQPAPVHFDYPSVAGRTEVVIVGSGPAGLFTALRLIERGYRPVILERGRDVSARKRDIAQINRNSGAGFKCPVRRGRSRNILRRQTFHPQQEAGRLQQGAANAGFSRRHARNSLRIPSPYRNG